MSCNFGNNVKITIFGQSHSEAIGVVIDGLPAGFEINMDKIAAFMARSKCMEDAVSMAKDFISDAIHHGADIEIGNGHGPVNHGFNPLKMMIYDF